MAEHTVRPRGTTLIAFALGVLHTVTLLVALGWLAYRGGGLGNALAGIGTAVGLAIFVGLWGVIGVFTLRAVRGLDFASVTPGRVFERGAIWGGFNGMAFAAPLLLFILVAGVVNATREGPAAVATTAAVLVFYVGAGTAVSFALGAIVGVIFGLLDNALLAVSRMIGPTRAEAGEQPVEGAREVEASDA
jgi:hypothetical protein